MDKELTEQVPQNLGLFLATAKAELEVEAGDLAGHMIKFSLSGFEFDLEGQFEKHRYPWQRQRMKSMSPFSSIVEMPVLGDSDL